MLSRKVERVLRLLEFYSFEGFSGWRPRTQTTDKHMQEKMKVDEEGFKQPPIEIPVIHEIRKKIGYY